MKEEPEANERKEVVDRVHLSPKRTVIKHDGIEKEQRRRDHSRKPIHEDSDPEIRDYRRNVQKHPKQNDVDPRIAARLYAKNSEDFTELQPYPVHGRSNVESAGRHVIGIGTERKMGGRIRIGKSIEECYPAPIFPS